jgi:hypothetical protein
MYIQYTTPRIAKPPNANQSNVLIGESDQVSAIGPTVTAAVPTQQNVRSPRENRNSTFSPAVVSFDFEKII